MRMIDMTNLPRPRVLIESPTGCGEERWVRFLANVCRWSLFQGYAPLPANIFTFVLGGLDAAVAAEAEAETQATERWAESAREVWICIPLGFKPTPELRAVYARHRAAGRSIYIRRFSTDGEMPLDRGPEEPSLMTDFNWMPEQQPAGATT